MSNQDLIDQAYGSAKLGRNGWYRANCPLCIIRKGSPDKRWSWGLDPDSGWWHCFRCGAHGSLTPSRPAPKVRRSREPTITPIDLPAEYQALAVHKPDPDDLFAGFDPGEQAIAYLASRGVSLGMARTLRIGWCSRGRYRNRIIMPVLVAGLLVGFVARSFERRTRIPYLYPEGMQRGSILWNQDAIEERTITPLLVVEGVPDAIPYWPDAASCLGKPSEDQIQLLARAKRPVVMCLDGDAWRLGRRVAERLAYDGARATFVRLPPKKDPNNQAINHGPMWLIERAAEAVRGVQAA